MEPDIGQKTHKIIFIVIISLYNDYSLFSH